MNYFISKAIAERYAIGRPYFHPHMRTRLQDFLNPTEKLEHALDIACGTGNSTKILLELANKVYGTDASEAMLYYAKQIEGIEFHQSPAEKQPFEKDLFELITVSCGIHWFDLASFMQEIHRILKKEGTLAIYNNYFMAQMVGDDNFAPWVRETYLKKFPSPSRNASHTWGNKELAPFNFHLAKEEKFTNTIHFTKEQLMLYFTTQSNISQAVKSQLTSFEEVDSWLSEELSSFFSHKDEQQKFVFGNWIKYIKKIF